MKSRILSTLTFLAALALWKAIRPEVVSGLAHLFQGLTESPLVIHGGLIRGNGTEVHTPGLTVLLPALLVPLWAKRPYAWMYVWAITFLLSLIGLGLFALALRDVPLSAAALTFVQLYLIRPLSMGIPLWFIFGDRFALQTKASTQTA